MQTAASKGRWIIVEVDATGRATVVDQSPSAVSRHLRPHEQRRLVHEPVTLFKGKYAVPASAEY